MNIIEGKFNNNNIKVAIIASRFNELIVSKLVEGALDGLKRHAVIEKDISLVWVPGAFEIPLIAKKIALQKTYDVIICLGAVIRGATSHFEYVSAAMSKGIANVSLETETPIIFAVLTTDNIEQALERAGTKSGNKGFDAALSALEMVDLLQKL